LGGEGGERGVALAGAAVVGAALAGGFGAAVTAGAAGEGSTQLAFSQMRSVLHSRSIVHCACACAPHISTTITTALGKTSRVAGMSRNFPRAAAIINSRFGVDAIQGSFTREWIASRVRGEPLTRV